MGATYSTLGGWAIIICIGGYYAYRQFEEGKRRAALRPSTNRQRIEDRHTQPKDKKDKAKRQRGEAYSKDVDESEKAAAKRTAANPAPAAPVRQYDPSSDDGLDNKEFARQLSSVKQGTSLNSPKKNEEKKQKSVKQSRVAREMDKPVVAAAAAKETPILSPPSSTAGVDADDDESHHTSPEVKATEKGDVSDMLEPTATGPSVLRLTDTDKVKEKPKKAKKAPEQTETKKQRQNRQKAEAAKALREETEVARKAAAEAQRRTARLAEGRSAQDGSAFTNAAVKSAWKGANNADPAANGNKQTNESSFLPVQPLDTFDAKSAQKAETAKPAQKVETAAKPAVTKPSNESQNWMSSMPSEEEQMEMLREEEAWSTVQTKKSKSRKPKAETATSNDGKDDNESNSAEKVTPVAPAASAAPVVQQQEQHQPETKPAVKFQQPTKPAVSNGKFGMLSNDDHEIEEEWDVS